MSSLSSHAHFPPHTAPLPEALPASDAEPPPLSTVWRRLLPLWRHLVWLIALFATLAAAVVVRLDVQSLRKDLDRNARARVEAQVVNDRLRLELDARRRSSAMEAVATKLQLGEAAAVIDIRRPQGSR